MHDDSWAAEPRCTACGRRLYAEEIPGYGCGVCVRTTDARLAELPGPPVWTGPRGDRKLVSGYYAALATAYMPGSAGDGGRVSGTRSAPLPLRLEPLNLAARGGIVTVLQTWLVDWHERLGWTHPRWQGDLQSQLDQVVAALRVNLEWAAEQHPAFDEFVREVREHVAACRRQATGETPERHVTVACPCGAGLSITLSTPGKRCGQCGASHTWEQLRDLPLVERSAA